MKKLLLGFGAVSILLKFYGKATYPWEETFHAEFSIERRLKLD